MTEQYREFVDAGAEVLAVVNDSLQSARLYVRQQLIPFPVITDLDRRVHDLYRVASKAISLGQRPGLFLIDRDGIIRFAQVGWQQWNIPRNDYVLSLCREAECCPNTLGPGIQ